MGVAVVLCVLGLAAVLVVLYREAPPVLEAAAPTPAWGPLPEPEDVTAVRFPTAAIGYDRRAVDAHYGGLATAYAHLVAVAPEDVLRRAEDRASGRAAARAAARVPGRGATPSRDRERR